MIKLVLLRHGESIWNKENRFTGWTDVGLTEKGIEEAREAAQALKKEGYDFDVVFSSSISGLPHALNLSKLRNKKCIVQVLDVPQWRLNEDPLYPQHWRQQWLSWAKKLEEVDEIVVNVPQTTELLLELKILADVGLMFETWSIPT